MDFNSVWLLAQWPLKAKDNHVSGKFFGRRLPQPVALFLAMLNNLFHRIFQRFQGFVTMTTLREYQIISAVGPCLAIYFVVNLELPDQMRLKLSKFSNRFKQLRLRFALTSDS